MARLRLEYYHTGEAEVEILSHHLHCIPSVREYEEEDVIVMSLLPRHDNVLSKPEETPNRGIAAVQLNR